MKTLVVLLAVILGIWLYKKRKPQTAEATQLSVAEKQILAGEGTQLAVTTPSGLATMASPAEVAKLPAATQSSYLSLAQIAYNALNGTKGTPENVLATAMLKLNADVAGVGEVVKAYQDGNIAQAVSPVVGQAIVDQGATTLYIPNQNMTNLYIGGQLVAKALGNLSTASNTQDPTQVPNLVSLADAVAASNTRLAGSGWKMNEYMQLVPA